MLTGYVRVSTDDSVPMWVFCSGADTVGELGDPGLFCLGRWIWPKKAILGSAAWLYSADQGIRQQYQQGNRKPT